MNEVEKMYENAGVEMEFAYLECHRGRSSICCPIDECEKDDECMGCINFSAMEEVYKYPPFTAEKQLSLMAFLINRKVELSFKAEQREITVEAISRGLAGIVNRIWQDLTDTDKVQIKEILE